MKTDVQLFNYLTFLTIKCSDILGTYLATTKTQAKENIYKISKISFP